MAVFDKRFRWSKVSYLGEIAIRLGLVTSAFISDFAVAAEPAFITANTQTPRMRQGGVENSAESHLDDSIRDASIPHELSKISIYSQINVDLIYDRKNAGLKEVLIPSTFSSVNENRRNFSISGKSSQFGVILGESKSQAVFIVDLFGSVDSYDFRLRDFYFEYGSFFAGLSYTALLDGAAWPLTLDAQGPNSVTFARQSGVRWQGKNLTLAIEDPNPEILDPGDLLGSADRRPDIIATWDYSFSHGHTRVGFVNREVGVELEGGEQQFATASGGVVSGSLALTNSFILLGSASFGKAMAHYFNDLSGFGSQGMDGFVMSNNRLKLLVAQGGYLGGQWDLHPNWTFATVAGVLSLQTNPELPEYAMKLTRYGALTILRADLSGLNYGAEISYGLRDDQAGNRTEALRLQFKVTNRFEFTNR